MNEEQIFANWVGDERLKRSIDCIYAVNASFFG